MKNLYLPVCFLLAYTVEAHAANLVRKVEIEGNLRIPAASILHRISVVPQTPFDPAQSQADLKKLYALGLFKHVEVMSREVGNGQLDLIYRIQERPFVSRFEIRGVSGGLERQIEDLLRKEKLELQTSTPYNPSSANKAALAVREFLRVHKRPNTVVAVVIESKRNTVGVTLQVQPGPQMEVGAVRFTGNMSISDKELLKQIRHARPGRFLSRWRGEARYIPDELNSNLQQLRHYYQSQGFASVVIGKPVVTAQVFGSGSDQQKIQIEIPITEGPRYQLTSIRTQGNTGAASEQVSQLVRSMNLPRTYDYVLLENTRQRIMDLMGHKGYALADVRLEEAADESDRTLGVTYKIAMGNPVEVGRISFLGNHRIPQKFLRRELKLQEGEVFDSAKLDQSLEKLNRSNMVQTISRANLTLNLNRETGLLDITIQVKEKERQGIYGTGGTGRTGAGYLGILYSAFNLLGLGETLSLELDGGAAQSNMLLDLVGTHFFGTPFTVALSVFHRLTDLNVTGLVPGPEDLVTVLRRRSTGIGLSSAYPLTSDVQLGLGFQVQQDKIVNNSTVSKSVVSDLSPFLSVDKTRRSGADTRGYRVGLSYGLSGESFLKSLDSTHQSFRFARYFGDPLTNGRNALAFQFQAAAVRPQGSGPLFLERRFFPGDESIRGFKQGALTPWARIPSATSDAQPAGADTVLGFSAEYRVPFQGPLSGIGFFDLGWTRIDPREAAQLGDGARLIAETNGILRASVGGELRLQLPLVKQPARVIFSWNPLRLRAVLQDPSTLLRLQDPRSSIRFALGNSF